jgi:protein-disulfide isomerase
MKILFAIHSLVLAMSAVSSLHASEDQSNRMPVSNTDPVIATFGEHSILLSQVDASGGRALYDASQKLYEVRAQSLYKLLAQQVLTAEAAKRNTTIDNLTESEIIAKIGPVSDVDIDSFMKTQQLDTNNSSLRNKVAAALKMDRANAARQRFVSSLFTTYNLNITLPTPPDPPKETVRGQNTTLAGPADASVTVIVFSDFQCPYCQKLAGTLAQLRQQFPKDVKVVFRSFPLHQDSQQLAEAALCAEDQHKFWEYHDLLFSTRATAANVYDYATKLNLNTDQFKSCLDSGKHKVRVIADATEAKSLQIDGTPTVFINGVRLTGAVSLQRLANEVKFSLNRAAQVLTTRPLPPG